MLSKNWIISISWFFYPLMVLASCWTGCAGLIDRAKPSSEECIREIKKFLHTAPDKQYLVTLDNQRVPLSEFFSQCEEKYPYCALYSKFYWWKNEIREIVSDTNSGPVNHKIRVYHNILSTCDPESINPLRTHGDVAEFYDENGQFMGLAVYMGHGLYCPLPYSNYEGRGFLRDLLSAQP